MSSAGNQSGREPVQDRARRTRERILETAAAAFARDGYEGTSLNALIRASSTNPVHIGAHTLVGPMASISGATIGDEVFLATGTRVFNGAHIDDRCEVRINGVVHLRTHLPADTVVPIGWVAVGDPVKILPPEKHEEIWASQKELDFPGYVFGLDRETPDLMAQLTERYGRSLARHAEDRRVD